jgi:ABC-type branched-subunit amino acid transport system substrate-binding protein
MRSTTWRNRLFPFALAAVTASAACGGAEARPTPGVVGDTISVGVIVPLSDAVAVIGTPMSAGLQTYVDALNARGGIGGKYMVKLVVEDQTYANPSTSAQKYQKIKDQVAYFGIVVGTDHVNTLLPLLNEDSLMLAPATFDSEWIREPMLMPWNSTYQLWAYNAIGYYRTEGGGAGKNVCAMALATGFGDAGLEGVELAAKNFGFTVAATVRYKQDDQDYVAALTQLRNAKCDMVLLVSLPANTGRILGTAAQARFAPQWVTLSPGWHGALIDSPLRDYLAKYLWITFDAGNWGDTTLAGMRQLMEARSKYRPDQKADLYYFAGFAMGVQMEALLNKAAELGDLSRGGIVRASEALGVVDFGGMSGNFTYGPAATREPPRTVSIFRVDPSNEMGLSTLRTGFRAAGVDDYKFERTPR